MGEPLLVIAVGFLAGMIPAMLLIGFLSGRQVEKQRKELQLKYDRQIKALQATLRRLMQRIDSLTGERNKLKRSNKSLREAVRNQQHIVDESESELVRKRTEITDLKEQVDALAQESLRYEGRLEEARINQDKLSAQFKETVIQFNETERLRRNLLFAVGQLQRVQGFTDTQTAQAQRQPAAGFELNKIAPEKLDVSTIDVIESMYVERLHESGIHTVADLAAQTPARIAHFAGLDDEEESGKWIATARALIDAAPDAPASD